MKIEINKANVKELASIKGIGDKKAAEIITYRQKNGFFQEKKDIKNVKGIGEIMYHKFKDNIKVENLVYIEFKPLNYNISEINEVHLVGTMNNWDPANKNYSLQKKRDDYWAGYFPLEDGEEYKIMYDSETWEKDKYVGDFDGQNFVVEK
ncbi:MAG: helix-hairpin-helix domain-containing protein [Bacillota bacterium]